MPALLEVGPAQPAVANLEIGQAPVAPPNLYADPQGGGQLLPIAGEVLNMPAGRAIITGAYPPINNGAAAQPKAWRFGGSLRGVYYNRGCLARKAPLVVVDPPKATTNTATPTKAPLARSC